MVCTSRLVVALRQPDTHGERRPFVVLEVLAVEYFFLGATRFVAIDPHGIWSDQAAVQISGPTSSPVAVGRASMLPHRRSAAPLVDAPSH